MSGRSEKTMLAIGLCLIAINLIDQKTKTGPGMVETARIGPIRGDDFPRHSVEQRSVIEKRFVFQGPQYDWNLDNLSSINLSFSPGEKNQFNGSKRTVRNENALKNDSEDDDEEDDDSDEEGDEDRPAKGNKNAKVEHQRPTSAGDLSGTQQVLAAAANRSEHTGVLLPAPVVVQENNKKPDEGIRPRLFKLGLLIG